MAEKQSIKRFIVRDPHGHIEKEDGFSVVGEVHVGIDDGVGEPSAESEYVDGKLTITLHNLKGEGISDISFTPSEEDGGENLLTITTNGGNTYTFPILNGQTGERGKGIKSIAYASTAEDGGENLLTITDDDDVSHEFVIRNGQTGKDGKQGDSVIVGQGDLPLTHILGGYNTKAMSQLGVTEQLIEEWVSMSRDGDIDSGLIVNTDTESANFGKVVAVGSNHSPGWHKRVKFRAEPGQVYKLEYYDNNDPVSTSNRFVIIAFSESATLADGNDVLVLDYAVANQDNPIELFSRIASVPSSGYLYIFYRTASGYNNGYRGFVGKTLAPVVQELDAKVKEIAEMAVGDVSVEEWTSGYVLQYQSGQGASGITKVVANANYKVSKKIISVDKGDVVTMSHVDGTTFVAIAFGTSETTLYQRKWSSGAPVSDAIYSYEAEADGYVRVCGGAKSVCVISKANALIHKKDIKNINSGMPEYWEEYLPDKETIIKNDTLAGDTESFVFITDTHPMENVGNSADLVEHIISHTPVCKTIFGGDVCATGDAVGSWQNKLVKGMRKQEAIANAARKNGKYYAIRGNHDFFEYNGGTKYSMSYKKAVARIKAQSDNYDVVMADDENGCYYYVDNSESNIRIIFIDSVYGSTTGHQRLSLRQLNWIIDAIASSTKDVVIVGHLPAAERFAKSNEMADDYYKCLREVILAANKRLYVEEIEYTTADSKKADDPDIGGTTSCDFTGWNNNVILFLNGHSHIDNQAYYDGVPFVTTICDKQGQYLYSPFAEGTSLAVENKNAGTTNEQAFDVVSIPSSHDMVVFRRIGIGFDRTFHVGEIKLSNGNSIELSPTIDPTKWVSSNCEIGQIVGNTWPYLSNIVSVENGVVTALKTGEAFVFAEDTDHNKEFWAITVE